MRACGAHSGPAHPVLGAGFTPFHFYTSPARAGGAI